jgi:hypothetical protein
MLFIRQLNQIDPTLVLRKSDVALILLRNHTTKAGILDYDKGLK